MNITARVFRDYDLASLNVEDFINNSDSYFRVIPLNVAKYTEGYLICSNPSDLYYRDPYRFSLKKLVTDFSLFVQGIDDYADLEELTVAEIIEELSRITIENYYKTKKFSEGYDFLCVGYQQGDCLKILKKGRVPDFLTKDYLTKLFYDIPVSGSILIDDDELDIHELLSDYYIWNKSEVVAKVCKKYPSAKPWLEANLPESV